MIRLTACVLCLGLGLVFGYVYFVDYVQRRDCFNELGRCFDEGAGVVYSEQAGSVWLSLAVIALAAFLYHLWHVVRSGR